jgi:hypothetical protein
MGILSRSKHPMHCRLGRACNPRRAGCFVVATIAGLAGGCAQPGPFAQRSALVGSLRESVSQLEVDKQRLERQVAELGSENQRLEERLVQEEAYNDELAARLESGRKIVERSSSEGTHASDSFDSPRTIPSRRPRQQRVPMAQILGEVHPVPEPGDFQEGRPGSSSGARSTPPEDESDDFDLFSSADAGRPDGERSKGRETWLPIARGRGGSSSLR